MRYSKFFLKTYKDNPADAEVKSHQLMLRAGYIKKESAGVYSYLPLGLRVLRKIESIIRNAMNEIGGQEVLLPSLSVIDNYSGRLNKFGDDMFKLKDRYGKQYCLSPTHEEIFTLLVKDQLQSYKELPFTLYQFQNKFRDEARPRYGLMRVREFIMKDGYSFDKDFEGLEKSYQNMFNAYCKIFDKLGLKYIVVNADNGAMGGSASQEFMVKSEIGDDTLVLCEHCNTATNEEKACTIIKNIKQPKQERIQKVFTPDTKTIEQLVNFLGKSSQDFGKTLIYKCDNDLVAVLIRGDREVQETKLKNYIDCDQISLATPEEVLKAAGVEIGFVGPLNIKKTIRLVVDNSMKNKTNFITGAGEKDYHYINTNFSDITHSYEFADVNACVAGDICPVCGKEYKLIKGIEVGHVFKQGTLYSDRLGCRYIDENGQSQPVILGSYGIGLGRTMASVIEQNSDNNAIKLPKNIAPFTFAVLAANTKDEEQTKIAEKLYNSLNSDDILYDDRNVSFGIKMKDIELIGIPYIIVVGRDSKSEQVELIDRLNNKKSLQKISTLKSHLNSL